MKCKFCGSKNVIKAGIHYAGSKKQRYLCKDCGRLFTDGVGEREVGSRK